LTEVPLRVSLSFSEASEFPTYRTFFMKELLISLLNFFGLAWWVEVKTSTPRCIYYFGPFMRAKEAEAAKAGYIEDIENEGAQGIKVLIQRCKPIDLTVAEDLGKLGDGGMLPVFSGQ
jgi:Domain of unknown function (DUF1816).